MKRSKAHEVRLIQYVILGMDSIRHCCDTMNWPVIRGCLQLKDIEAHWVGVHNKAQERAYSGCCEW